MSDRDAAVLVRSADEGEARWFYGGGVHIWKATAEDTAGSFLLFEDRMDAGKVTPLHTHASDETIVVCLARSSCISMDPITALARAG